MATTEKPKITLPKLSQEELQFAENLIALGMPYTPAIQSFLESFPDVLENYQLPDELTEEEREQLTEEEIETQIRGILRTRFRGYRKDKRRAPYHRIKATKETIKGLLDCIPVANPFQRIKALEIMRQDKSLKPEQLLKVFAAARREVEILLPPEKPSPFRGMGMELPDLSQNKDENGNGKPDPFGGAMMQNTRPPDEKE